MEFWGVENLMLPQGSVWKLGCTKGVRSMGVGRYSVWWLLSGPHLCRPRHSWRDTRCSELLSSSWLLLGWPAECQDVGGRGGCPRS